MENVILVIHLFLALAIIGLVLLQRSEGGGLGIGGGGMGGLATPKGTANLLTRATAICAGAFFCTSLILGVMAGQHSKARMGLAEALEGINAPAAIEQPADENTDQESNTDGEGAEEELPSVPIAE